MLLRATKISATLYVSGVKVVFALIRKAKKRRY